MAARVAPQPAGSRSGLSVQEPIPARSRPRGVAATAALLLLTVSLGLGAAGLPRRPANPAGGAAPTLLLEQRLTTLPAGAAWAGVERYTAPPGAAWPQGTAAANGVGPMVYRIETGTVTVRATAAFAVTRRQGAAPSVIAAQMATILAAGDRAFLPVGVASDWRVAGDMPATILAAGITGGASGPWSSVMTRYTALVDDCLLPTLPVPALLRLRQATLAPGASLPGVPTAGLGFVSVAAGTLEVEWALLTVPAPPIVTSQVSAGTAIETMRPDAFVATLRNRGSDPVVLLILSVDPLAPIAWPPIV